jgi:hypothetical protein
MVAFMKTVGFAMASYVYVPHASQNQDQGRAPANGAADNIKNSKEELPLLFKLFKAARRAG